MLTLFHSNILQIILIQCPIILTLFPSKQAIEIAIEIARYAIKKEQMDCNLYLLLYCSISEVSM